MTVLKFRVPGQPVPQGSMRAYNSHVVHANASRLLPWRAAVTAAAQAAITEHDETWYGDHPMRVDALFTFAPLQKHFHRGGLRSDAPYYRSTRPDLDKLIRAVLDALTDAGVWADDAQVVMITSSKTYGAKAGCDVTVTQLHTIG